MADWGKTQYGKQQENWPCDAAGEPEEPALLLRMTGNTLDVEMKVNLLNAFGIPVALIYPNNGDFGKVIIGFSGTGTEIYVPTSMLEEAKTLIEGGAELPEDWEETSQDAEN